MVRKLYDYGRRQIITFIRRILSFIFHFDEWHTIPLSAKKYAKDIIRYLNNLQEDDREAIVEVGCGLGDLVRYLKFKERTGLDMDINVLRAVKFLSKISFNGKVNFQIFTFPESELNGKYDAIVLVNWIHNIPPETLKAKIDTYFTNSLTKNGRIIIDTVKDKEYKYNHDINFLTRGLRCNVIKIGDYLKEREVFIIASNLKE